MFSVVGKIYAGILVGRVRKLNEGLIDDEGKGVCRSDLYPKAER